MTEELVKRLREDFDAAAAAEQRRHEEIMARLHEIRASFTTPQAGDALERARSICAQVRPKHADGFLRGDYDEDSTEMQAVLIALSAAPNAGLVEALEHWERQAKAWLASREPHARPGWMEPAIAKGRAALDALRGG